MILAGEPGSGRFPSKDRKAPNTRKYKYLLGGDQVVAVESTFRGELGQSVVLVSEGVNRGVEVEGVQMWTILFKLLVEKGRKEFSQ